MGFVNGRVIDCNDCVLVVFSIEKVKKIHTNFPILNNTPLEALDIQADCEKC